MPTDEYRCLSLGHTELDQIFDASIKFNSMIDILTVVRGLKDNIYKLKFSFSDKQQQLK